MSLIPLDKEKVILIMLFIWNSSLVFGFLPILVGVICLLKVPKLLIFCWDLNEFFLISWKNKSINFKEFFLDIFALAEIKFCISFFVMETYDKPGMLTPLISSTSSIILLISLSISLSIRVLVCNWKVNLYPIFIIFSLWFL